MAVRVEYKTVRKTLADGTIKEYHYDRLTGKPINAKRGTASFARELQSLRTERGEIKWEKGTVGSLLRQYFESAHWRGLAMNTKTNYRAGLARLSGMEHLMVRDMRKGNLIAIRDKLEDKPGAANQALIAIQALLAFAVASDKDEWDDVAYNIASAVKRPRLGVWKRWPEEATAKFEAGEVTRESKIAFALLLYTGQRRGDVLRMRWADYNPHAYDGFGSIRCAAQKTSENDEDYLEIAIHPNLRVILDAEKPKTKSVFMVHRDDGRPFWSDDERTALTQATIFREYFQRNQEKVFGKGVFFPIHGLRKAAAAKLAEAGCSPHEIMAITGHKTISMVQLYTRGAEQKRRSIAAIRKWAAVER